MANYIFGFILLLSQTNDALVEAQKLRDEIAHDIYDFKQMKIKTEGLSQEVVGLGQRMDILSNRWRFLDDIIQVSDSQSSN